MMICGSQPLGAHTHTINGKGKGNGSGANSKYVPPKKGDQRTKAQRQADARKAAAKSKSKLWGPSHSFDSDDTSNINNNSNNNNNDNYGKLGAAPRQASSGNSNSSWWENMGKVWSEFGTGVQVTAADFMNNNCQKMATSSSSSNNSNSNKNRHWLSGKRTRSTGGLPMEPVKEETGEDEDDSTDPSTHEDELNQTASTAPTPTPTPTQSRTTTTTPRQKAAQKVEEWTDIFSNACGAMGASSPCSAQELEELFGRQRAKTHKFNKSQNKSHLGIAPLTLDNDDDDDDDEQEEEDSIFGNVQDEHKWDSPPTKHQQHQQQQQHLQQQQQQQQQLQHSLSDESPAERRRQRALVRRKRHEDAASSVCSSAPHEDYEVTSRTGVLVTQSSHPTSVLKKATSSHGNNNVHDTMDDDDLEDIVHFPPLPLETLLVKPDEALELERSISELTMKSSYQDITPRLAGDQRRMAYYAVGRHHRQGAPGPKSGGNRRCYFTGKLIFGGAPFYAGIVQQGLRTLVVFCLPSALGMPQSLPGHDANMKRRKSLLTVSNGSFRTGLLQRSRHKSLSSGASLSQFSKSPSKLSSVINIDDMSLSIEGDLDPNWNLDKDYLLSILPDPSNDLLAEMNRRYPEQFETLPVQVRRTSCWRLYVKFCFFSGLPIAEGELHYQVRHNLAMEVYGEEIVLSYDVMEVVNGVSSAEILKLPNLKTFRYLKKHYQQQSAKLPEVIFQRTSWEQVKPEV